LLFKYLSPIIGTEVGRGYGREAIEILLQYMENYRDDLVVIMAGYADRMETFFASDPGMSSRIAHHLDGGVEAGAGAWCAGVSAGKQQLEQIVAEAARDAPGSYPSRPAPACAAGQPVIAGPMWHWAGRATPRPPPACPPPACPPPACPPPACPTLAGWRLPLGSGPRSPGSGLCSPTA
jgi:hypothetical protein